jgi:hypothetical protein
VSTVERPSEPVASWRRGSEVRQWTPGDTPGGTQPADLEDAVIAYMIDRRVGSGEP